MKKAAVITAIVLLIAAAALLIQFSGTDTEYSRFNTNWNGTSDFFASADAPDIYDYKDLEGKTNTTLLVIAPTKEFGGDALVTYVKSGNTLIIADQSGNANRFLASAGTDIRVVDAPLRSSDQEYKDAGLIRGYVTEGSSLFGTDAEKLFVNYPGYVTGGNTILETSQLSWIDTNGNNVADKDEPLKVYSLAALIEPLAERQVTYDSVSYPLPKPFLTVASQNPYENSGGTFTLIDAQADRFAYSVVLTQLDRDDELSVLDREIEGALLSDEPKTPSNEINIDIDTLRSAVKEVHVSPEIRGYIADIIMATRKHGDVSLGSSTRGSIALLRGAQVIAAINGRGYVIPDDVKYIAPYTLRHRLFLKNEAVLSGVTQMRVLETILNTVTVR